MAANTTTHLRSTGRGENGARAAFASLTNSYDAFLRTNKRKTVVELFMAGRCSPLKDAPIEWSVTGRGDATELAWFADNMVN